MNIRKTWLTLLILFVATGFAVAQTPETRAQSDKPAATRQSKETKAKATGKDTHGKLDINSASKDELVKLPGIGPVTAQKIIDGRPYRSKLDLLSRKIVSEQEYDNIRGQIVASQEKSAKQ